MEAVGVFETLRVVYQVTLFNISEDSNIQQHRCEHHKCGFVLLYIALLVNVCMYNRDEPNAAPVPLQCNPRPNFGNTNICKLLLITNLTHLFMYLFRLSTCFEHHSAHHQEIELY